MEEVVDHARFWAVLTNLQVKGGVHVHRHRFDASATLWPQLFEEWPDRRTAATFANPQHSPGIGVQHHAGVTMTFEQREFIHDQAPWLRLWQSTQRRLQGSTLQQPNAAPMQPEQLSHMQRGQAFAGLNDGLG